LPASHLKVAQAFVRNVTTSTDDAEIVSAIVAVARGLHMIVVAPGIETEEQLAFLKNFGCNRAQGFLLARPMSAKEFTEYLACGKVPAILTARVTS
jgi:EAL domain-containing protein (putative c-di-GMP-specific phosphodiesterase class I)